MIFAFLLRIVRAVFPSVRPPSSGANPRSPEDVEAALAAIAEALNRDSRRGRLPATPYTPSQRELSEDGLIVMDGPDMIPPWLRDPPCGPPPPFKPE